MPALVQLQHGMARTDCQTIGPRRLTSGGFEWRYGIEPRDDMKPSDNCLKLFGGFGALHDVEPPFVVCAIDDYTR
jgi:hypothetical protein